MVIPAIRKEGVETFFVLHGRPSLKNFKTGGTKMKNMKKVWSLLLALAMIMALAAGCSGGDNGGSSNGGNAENSQPADNGGAKKTNITIGLDGEWTTLDPSVGGNMSYPVLAGGIYETLLFNDGSGDLKPLLAESYEWQDDTTLVFHLRQGVKFHNGNDFAADDVLFTLQRLAENPNYINRYECIDWDNTYAEDDHTVVFKLHNFNASLTENFASCISCILDKDWYEEVGEEGAAQEMNGTGPYVLTEWKMGDYTLLSRNENYWGDAPYYDTITLKCYSEPTTRVMEYQTGTLDICYINRSQDIDQLESGAFADTYEVARAVHGVCGVGLTSWPEVSDAFLDIRVRQAIAYAIDVPTLVDSVGGSALTVANSILPVSDWAYADLGSYSYDPDKSRELLADYGKPVSFTMVINNSGYQPDIAEALQGYLSEVGIDMQIETYEFATFISKLINCEIAATINSNSGGSDPSDSFTPYERNSGNACAEFRDEELLTLLEQAKNEADVETRKGMYKEIQQIVHDNFYFIPLYTGRTVYAVRNGITGVEDSLTSENAITLGMLGG